MHDDLLFLSLFDHSRSPRDPSARVCQTDALREYPRPRAISPDPTLARCYPGLGKRARRAEGESPSAQGVPVATLPQGVKERMRVHFDASTTLSLPSCRLAVLPSCRLAVLPSRSWSAAMAASTTLTIQGYRDEPVPNRFLRPEGAIDQLAILLP